MAGRDPLNSIADLTALQAEADRIIAMVKGIDEAVKSVGQISLQVKNANGTAELKKSTDDLIEANKKLKISQQELDAEIEKGVTIRSEVAKKIAIQKELNRDQQKQLNAEAREAAGLNDAYKKLELQYNAAAREAKNLAATHGLNSKEAQEAATKAKALGDQLKTIDATVGQHQRNVGNYIGAIDTLRGAFDEVKQKMDQFNQSGNQNAEEIQKLQREYDLLDKLVNQQAQGFASVTAEIRATDRALQTLAAAGMQNSEAFQALQEKMSEAKREAREFKEQQKLLSSEMPAVAAMTLAVKGLSGAYAIGAGATALLADGNEKVEKELNKLVAVMTILQGLNEVHELLEKKNTIAKIAGTAATNLAAAAESKNVVVKYAAIAAQRTLNFVTSAAGGPILVLIGLLASAAAAFASYGEDAETAAEKNERLNKSLERSNEAISKGSDAIKQRGEKALADLEENFATEAQIRQQNVENLQEEIDNVKRINETDVKNRQDTQKQIDELFKKKFRKGSLDEDDQKALDDAKKRQDGYLANLEKQTGLENQLGILQAHNSRATKEEKIKAEQDELEISKSNLQIRARIQNDIVGNERKSYTERRAALTEFQKFQTQIISTDLHKQLLVPTLTPSQRRVLITQAKATTDELNSNVKKQKEEFNRQELERERKAQSDIARAGIEIQMNAAQEIMSDENNSLAERLAAAQEFQKKQEGLIINQKDLELANDTLTADERKAIEAKANEEIIKSRADFQKRLQDITLSEMNEDARNRIAKGNKERDEAITALNNQFNAGKIGLQEYNKERLKLEQQYSVASLQIQIDNTKKLIAEYKSEHKSTAEEEAKLAELEKNLSDQVTNKKINNLQKLKEKEKEISDNLLSLMSNLVTSGYEREINALQVQIDTNTKLKDTETERINNSTLSEQDKAAKLAQINATAQAQQDQLQAKQKQEKLKDAKFQRDLSLASIAWDTAKAIMKDTANVPWPASLAIAAADAALGVAQAAAILAKPLPQYATGTDYSPEGFAIVGEKGPELRINPSGEASLTPGQASLTYLQKGTQIIPHDEVNKIMLGMMMQQTAKAVDSVNEHLTTARLEKKLDQVTKAVQWQTDELKNAWAYIARQNRTIIKKDWKDFGKDYLL